MNEQMDSRVVKTVRSLRKMTENQSLSGSSTRTNTPMNNSFYIEILSKKAEMAEVFQKFCLSPGELYEMVKSDWGILRDLDATQSLSDAVKRRVVQRIEERQSKEKIEKAKTEVSAKIQERVEALKKMLDSS